MDIKRFITLTPNEVETFFNEFCHLRCRYSVTVEDIYNMDEKGFQMGKNQRDYVIYNKEDGLLIIPTTDISKWVIIIKFISAAGAVD